MNEADWIKFLLGVIMTMLCSAFAYYQGAKGKQSIDGCTTCREDCRRDVQAKIDALKARQDALDDEISEKLDIVFQMLRAAIQFLPIDEREKVNILNTRGKK